MKKYAVLNSDNVVNNIIIANSLEIAEQVTGSICIFVASDDNTCKIGQLYSGGVFIDPPVEEETPA
jgi:hypothetical protein